MYALKRPILDSRHCIYDAISRNREPLLQSSSPYYYQINLMSDS